MMNSKIKYAFGSLGWIEMVGEEMSAAIELNPPPAGYRVSFSECYHGGPELFDDLLLPGFRVDVAEGALQFRAGAYPNEEVDVRLDADYNAVEILSKLHSSGPEYAKKVEHFLANEKLKIKGSLADISCWSDGVHDAICERTL